MAAISSHGGTSSAFADALSKFQATLKKEELESFSSVTAGASSMEDVRKAATAIQERQLREDGIMRNVRRIQPLINGLQQFSGVIEVFVQSKPEVLALLWGPVKFLLQVASSYITAYEKLMDAFQKIGENLSRFQEFSIIFKKTPRMQQVIVMIFEEILEFYQLTLKYFRCKYWKKLFKSMWGTFEDRFGKILSNLDQHKVLIDSEATAAHIAHVHAAIRQAQAANEAARLHRDKQDLDLTRKWLAPVNYDASLAKLGAPCTATGGWFSREDDVQAWLDEANKTSRLLWLTGIPGSGKTFLSSIFLAHTKSTFPKGISIAYAFLRDNDSNFAEVIRTLVAQLLHHSNQLLRYLEEKRESNPYPPSSQAELQEILDLLLGDIGITYLFIDGLDEIDIKQREMVLGTICFLLPKAENLRVFLSSRYEVDISDSLKGIDSHIRRVDIGTKNQSDIDTYVTGEGKAIFKKYILDDTMRQEIQNILDRVCWKAEGMFLWARLVMYDLKSQVDMEGLEYAADNLPTGLEEAYGRILNRINEKITERERDLAKRVLAWIMYSKRPLSLNELMQAMAISEGDRCMNERKRIRVRLDELCGPIVEFDARDKIRFVHFTVKEYLKSEYSASFKIIPQVDAHRDMAITCITYLSFTCVDTSIEDKMVIDFVRSGEYCLYQYAESYWLDHVKDAIKLGNDNSWVESLVPLLDRLVKLRLDEIPPHRIDNLKPSGEHQFLGEFSRWPEIQRYLLTYHNITCGNAVSGATLVDPFGLQISVKRFRKQLEILFTSESKADKDKLHQYYGENIFKCSQVHCAYYVEGFGVEEKRDEHLNTHTRPVKCSFQGCDFESIGFATPSALKAHVQRYHPIHTYDEEKCNLSSPNAGQPLGISDPKIVLFDSISTRDLEVVKTVLELGLCLDSVFKGDEPVLHHALKAGSEDIFRLLLEKGANADEIDRRSKATILSSAVSRGLEQCVQLLLDWGADINKGGEGENSVAPLSLAINVCYNLVRLLLENGADANTAGSGGIPALILAVEAEQTAIAKLLLEYGANVDSTDSKGVTALVYAARKSAAIVQLLLEKGADANGLDYDGIPALVLAASNGQTETVKLLLEYGVNVDSKAPGGETALIYAASRFPAVVQLLLEKGADADGLYSNGKPALVLAASNGQAETVKLLLEYGANVDSKAPGGETALVYAASRFPAIVQLLLEKGADADGLDSIGRPALVVAVFNEQTETVKLLLEYGANVDSTDSKGVTALVYAASESPAIVQLLLEKGADADGLDSIGRPALVVAVLNEQTETVKLLLEFEANVDSKAPGGETALIYAASRFPAIVQLLLEKGADADGLDSIGRPALVVAVLNGQTETVKLLLEYGVNVDSKAPGGETALVYAARRSPAIVQLLLEKGADANGLKSSRTPALVLAASNGQTETVKLLLEYGVNVDSKAPGGETALVYAAARMSPAIVQLLLEKGADANGLNSSGTPALVLAASNGQTETVKLLLEYGANVDSKDRQGRTALERAAGANLDVFKLLLDKGAEGSTSRLLGMAGESSNEVLGYLLRGGTNISVTDKNGIVPFIIHNLEICTCIQLSFYIIESIHRSNH
ncbi:ankyrin repeat-containing domain protein [Morchella snyderi]|nr:ankyrin repeat-containing domain protein [Morchella snyderi]